MPPKAVTKKPAAAGSAAVPAEEKRTTVTVKRTVKAKAPASTAPAATAAPPSSTTTTTSAAEKKGKPEEKAKAKEEKEAKSKTKSKTPAKSKAKAKTPAKKKKKAAAAAEPEADADAELETKTSHADDSDDAEVATGSSKDEDEDEEMDKVCCRANAPFAIYEAKFKEDLIKAEKARIREDYTKVIAEVKQNPPQVLPPEPKVKMASINKQLRAQWKALSDEEKKEYMKPRLDAKWRVNGPKKAKSAYLYFSLDPKNAVKPAPGETKVSFKARASQHGANWQLLTPEQKKPYEDMQAADKIRYGEEKQRWELEHPGQELRGNKRRKSKSTTKGARKSKKQRTENSADAATASTPAAENADSEEVTKEDE